ncbi:MAG: 6-phosphofructokinase [Flavobacteriales bacterium]
MITSGGDSPGMNAALRSVVRSSIYHGIQCFGFKRGFQGVIENDYKELKMRSVSKILGLGGTMLKTARSTDFLDASIREKAHQNLKRLEIDALVVIGGNGSLTGANVFSQQFDFSCVGIPASIDNDIYGTDYSIGFHTSLQTIVESIDKIRDTARSHNRLFFVEVMGRDNGSLALHSSLATGACYVIIPEKEFKISDLAERLREGKELKKTSSIVIVAEGNTYGPSYKIASDLIDVYSEYETKVSILGHLQRGGAPVAEDRIIASRLGMFAVETVLQSKSNHMVGITNNDLVLTPLLDVVDKTQNINEDLFNLNNIISK